MVRGTINLFPVVYLIFAVYFVSFGLGYIVISESILKVHDFILIGGGVLLFFAAYRAFFYSKRRMMRRLYRR